MDHPPGQAADPSGGDVPVPPPPVAVAPAHEEGLNLKQVARLLDVHYMTAYRYVRNGRLPARRQGQIWLVDPTDVEEFRRDRPAGGATGRVDWPDRLARRLLAGDEVGAWTVVTDALSAGHTPQACHLDLLAPAMRTLDGEVNAGHCTGADRRVATTIAMRLVARLGATFRHRGRCRGTVVTGTPTGEHDGLHVAILANLVRLDGFSVRELGTDVPPATFVQSCRGVHDLLAVVIGILAAERLPAAHEVVDAVHAVRPDLPVVIASQDSEAGTAPIGSAVVAYGAIETLQEINFLAAQPSHPRPTTTR